MNNHKSKKTIPTLKKSVLAALTALAISGSADSSSAEETKVFNIAAQPLGAALRSLADQANVQLIFTETDVVSIDANGVSGNFTLEQALSTLLNGTGLIFKRTANNVIVVQPLASQNKAKHSQDAELKGWNNLGIEEVIVTATKREANMQDIPMSINAFSGKRLEESGVENVQDIQFLAAGLQVTDSLGVMRVTVRGIGASSLAASAESGAAIHRDGVYLAQRQDLGMGFFDVERIEVLRGPQGTLYGRNATGGAINIISKAPTPEFDARAGVSVGNYDLIETDGYVSGPLASDKLLARVAFKIRHNDGYTPNVFNGEGYNDDDLAALRGKLHYAPTDNFRLDLSADYARDNGFPIAVGVRRVPNVPLAGEMLGGTVATGRAVNLNNKNKNEKAAWGFGAKAEWEVGDMILTSLTGYRELATLFAYDFDGTDASAGFVKELTSDAMQVSQEMTLSSTSAANLQWVVGAYYFYSDLSVFQESVLPLLGGNSAIFTPKAKGDAYALFGEASYPLLDRLSLTFGARYSYEEKSIHQWSTFAGTPTGFERLRDSWGAFTPKVALTYDFSDSIIAYATVSRGFKAGGFTNNALQGEAFDPEKVINYEVGLKTSSYTDRLRTNISAFHMDYTDLQVEVRKDHPTTGAPVLSTDNAASAVIRGVEFEVQAQATDNFTVDGNVSWLDATFDRWPDAFDPTREANFDVSNNQIPHTPEWALNLGASYTIVLGTWGSVNLRGEYSYKSRTFFTPFESEPLSQEEFSLANARLTFEEMSGRWSVAAWVKNATDELVASDIRSGAGSSFPAYINYLPPRTYGVTIDYQF